MFILGYKNVFRMMPTEYDELRRLGKINTYDKIYADVNDYHLQELFQDMINEVMNLNKNENIDLRYYEKLLDVEDNKLKKRFIYHDDPFFPLYRHVENLLEDISRLKEMPIPEYNEDGINDILIKSILSNRKLFLEDLNMSMCTKYSLKYVGCCNIRFHLEKENRIRMNDIILQRIQIQQSYLAVYLSQDQKQLYDFVNISMAFETLEMSFNQLCRNEDYGEIEFVVPYLKNNDYDKNDNPLVRIEKRSKDNILMTNNYQNLIKKPTLRFPNKINPQALPIYQHFNSKNKSHRSLRDVSANEVVPLNSHDQLDNVNSKDIDLYNSYKQPNYVSSNGLGLCFFISLQMFFGLLLIIILKKIF